MYLTTPSAILRDWTIDDAMSLARHANNPQIAAGMRDAFPHPYTFGDAETFIAMATENHTILFLAIDVDHEAVGGIGIHPLVDVHRGSAEIGYWLSQEYWGRGIVTDVVWSIIPVAFNRFPITRLQAGIF
jgi:RimJ/RimL family protein N-acetyltransferase